MNARETFDNLTWKDMGTPPLCLECHKPLLEHEPTDKTGTMHFEPCAGEYEQRMADQAVDRALEGELWREWGGR